MNPQDPSFGQGGTPVSQPPQPPTPNDGTGVTLTPQAPMQPPVVASPPITSPEPIIQPQATAPVSVQGSTQPVVNAAPVGVVTPPADAVEPTMSDANYTTPVPQANPNLVSGSEPQKTPVSFNDAAVSANSAKQKPKLVQLLVIGTAFIVIIGAAIAGFLLWKSNQLDLETYKGEGYSVLVPSDYKETEDDGGVVFEEQTDDDSTKSRVVVISQEIGALTQEEFNTIKEDPEAKKVAKDMIEGYDEDGARTKDISCAETMSETQIVSTCKAVVVKDDKEIGDLHLRLIIDKDNGMGVVAIAAHTTDKGLNSKSQKIMDSFKFE